MPFKTILLLQKHVTTKVYIYMVHHMKCLYLCPINHFGKLWSFHQMAERKNNKMIHKCPYDIKINAVPENYSYAI